MSDTNAEATGETGEATAPEAPEADEQQAKTFNAEYVEKLRKESAKYRTEAKANADAAKRLAEIEESQKSEAEKAAERLRVAEQAAVEAEAKVLRRDIALEHSLTREDAALLDTITDEDAMRALAERLKPSEEPTGPRPPKPDANQGRSGSAPKSSGDQFADFADAFFTRK